MANLGEGELLFTPLAHLEVIGNPRVEEHDSKPVLVVSIKVNINQKSKTLEEILGLRKQTIITAGENLKKEILFDFKLVSEKQCDLSDFSNNFNLLIKHDPVWFNSGVVFIDAMKKLIEYKEKCISRNYKKHVRL